MATSVIKRPYVNSLILKHSVSEENDGSCYYYTQDNDGSPRTVIASTTGHRIAIYQYHTGDGYADVFYLPVPDATGGKNTTYDILTSKNMPATSSTKPIYTAYAKEYLTGENNDNDNYAMKCISYGGGLKRLSGIFTMQKASASSYAIIKLPEAFSWDKTRNGNAPARGFFSIQKYNGTESYPCSIIGTNIYHAGITIPIGDYIIDYWYF